MQILRQKNYLLMVTLILQKRLLKMNKNGGIKEQRKKEEISDVIETENNGTVSDILLIRDIILEEPNTIQKINKEDRWAADVNKDGSITVSDIILVRDRILGIVDDSYKPIN